MDLDLSIFDVACQIWKTRLPSRPQLPLQPLDFESAELPPIGKNSLSPSIYICSLYWIQDAARQCRFQISPLVHQLLGSAICPALVVFLFDTSHNDRNVDKTGEHLPSTLANMLGVVTEQCFSEYQSVLRRNWRASTRTSPFVTRMAQLADIVQLLQYCFGSNPCAVHPDESLTGSNCSPTLSLLH